MKAFMSDGIEIVSHVALCRKIAGRLADAAAQYESGYT